MARYHIYILLSFLVLRCGSSQHESLRSGAEYSGVYEQNQKERLIEEKRDHLIKNYRYEMGLAIASGDDAAVASVESKYRVLESIFSEHEMKLLDTDSVRSAVSGEHNPGALSGKPFAFVDHPLLLREVRKVYTDFGHLYISETPLNAQGRVVMEMVQAEKRPWSSYWYPFRDKALYTGSDSVLKKFDRLVDKIESKHGYSSVALSEQKSYGSYHADGWEGLCDAWAIASIVVNEPMKAKTIYGIRFGISDQKALALFAHSKYPYQQYGTTYRGDAETDGTYQGLKPEAFHRIVTHVLAKEKRGVIIDRNPGVEIWNQPLFQYGWKILKESPQTYLVSSAALVIDSRRSVSDVLTAQNDIVTHIYDYRLYVDRTQEKNGKYRVIASEWTGESIRFHPGNVKYILPNYEMKSHNKEFNKHIRYYKKHFG